MHMCMYTYGFSQHMARHACEDKGTRSFMKRGNPDFHLFAGDSLSRKKSVSTSVVTHSTSYKNIVANLHMDRTKQSPNRLY